MAPAATLPPAAPAARRMPVRTRTVSFEWEGVAWSAEMRTNAPSKVIDGLLERGDVEAFKASLSALVLAWDFVDEGGAPIPLPRDGGLAPCPYPLLNALVSAYLDALAVPKES